MTNKKVVNSKEMHFEMDYIYNGVKISRLQMIDWTYVFCCTHMIHLPPAQSIFLTNWSISIDLLQVSVVRFPNATDSGELVQKLFHSKVQYNMQLEINYLIVESWEDYAGKLDQENSSCESMLPINCLFFFLFR